MRYKDVDKTLPEIARELNVATVVEGTVYQAGENVRIRVQLIEVFPQERNLWAHTYEQPMTEVLAMYNEVARAIADKTRIKLTPEETTRLTNVRQVNPEAYTACLKGMSHWYKLTPPDFDVAQQYFELALENDPNYALAHTGMFLVLTSRAQITGLVAPSEVMSEARSFLLRALELDDTLVEAHFAMAVMKTWFEWDWEAGEAAFLRAIELNPNFAMARVYYSNLLCYMGRPEEAIAQAERALELDPLNSMFMGMYGNALVLLGRYDEAIVMARKAIRTSPNDPAGLSILWESLHLKGQYEEALAEAKAFFIGQGSPIADVMSSGYEPGGYLEAMRSAAETMAAFSKQTYISPYFIAMMYALAGEKEKTLEWLEKGYEIKDLLMPYIGGHGVFNNLLYDDPRYLDLLRRMNLPEGKQ